VSEDYAVVSVLSRNRRRCVRPFQKRRPRSQRRTATSVEGLQRGMAVVPTRFGPKVMFAGSSIELLTEGN
jgi:hypothetical protein